jgi:hypothetical protein
MNHPNYYVLLIILSKLYLFPLLLQHRKVLLRLPIPSSSPLHQLPAMDVPHGDVLVAAAASLCAALPHLLPLVLLFLLFSAVGPNPVSTLLQPCRNVPTILVQQKAQTSQQEWMLSVRDFVADHFQKRNARQNPRDCRDFDEQPADCVRNGGEGQHNWAVAGPVGQGGEHRRRRQQGPAVQDQGWHQLLPNANVLGELQLQI